MYLSALIPDDRPSHCPLIRISNESLPTPADIYTYTTAIAIPNTYIRKERAPSWGVHLIIYIKGLVAAGRYKINPRRRFCCTTAVFRFKFAKFDCSDR